MLVASGVMVIAARNPVHSVLFLILAFFNAAGLFVLLGAEFLAMILVIVYVGAVAVLFLFVVMMLDINFVELRQGFLQIPADRRADRPRAARSSWCWCSAPGRWRRRSAATAAAPTPAPAQVTNTAALGALLYTRYVYAFQAAGLILLVAMIGAIVLTLRARAGVRRQRIAAQVGAPARGHRRDRQGSAAARECLTMLEIGLAHYLTVAAILFTLGIFGIFLNRKNVIIILMSIELMLLAVNINFVAFSAFLHDLVGPGLRHVRADRRRGRGGDRARHPGRLFPQPRHHRGRRHQSDEGLKP